MGRILLLMASHTYRAGAFMEAARRLGLSITVGTEQEQVLAVANPEGYLHLDFTDLEQATTDIVEFAEKYKIDAVIATEDNGAALAAMASEALGLTGNRYVSVAAARDKYITRRMLSQAGLRTPRFARFPVDADPEELVAQVDYPCVVKPLSLSASRGVMRADNPAEFAAAFMRLINLLAADPGVLPGTDAARYILVEDYIPGEEVAVEGLLAGGMLSVLAIFDKPDPLVGPFFEETIYVTPSRHPSQHQQAMIDEVQQATRALGLSDGPIHAELRFDGQHAWIIEVAPRSIGGYCSRALNFEGGDTLEDLIIRHALTQPIPSTGLSTPASGVMMIPIPARGYLCKTLGLETARAGPLITEILITIQPGQLVLPLPEGKSYLGFIFARGETPQVVEAALREAHAHLTFVIDPDEE